MTPAGEPATQGPAEFGTGWRHWNPQAFLDWLLASIVMSRIEDVIPKTYVPILRLVAEDTQKVDDDYRHLVSMRQPVRWLDSPRERWRKRYGSFVRELEWVFGELHSHFPKREYEELVVDILARVLKDRLWSFLPEPKDTPATSDTTHVQATAPEQTTRPRRLSPRARRLGAKARRAINGSAGQWIFRHFNPVGFMVGPVEMALTPEGEFQMHVPRCWWHTSAGDGRTQDEACMYGCKGASERVFNNTGLGIQLMFEPHLPEFSCTLHITTNMTRRE
jgi:hypothetical protein